MIAWIIQLFLGRHASLQSEVSRLQSLVKQRDAERAALAEQQALLKQISTLRTELGIS